MISELRERAEELLRDLAGPQAVLRPDQWTAIEALVEGRHRVLLVQRTGFGKSAVYFVATALLREEGAGPTVIVSPLLALMRNQVEAAARAGIRAATINSANLDEWGQIEASILAGEVDVLLVSPERLNNPDFRDRVLPTLAATCGLLVVDEAHCISDWGHDFRPDYRRIATFLAGLREGVPVLATTATANERVSADVAEQLTASHDGTSPHVTVLRGSLDRDSLRLGALRLPGTTDRLAWLGEHLASLPGSGIVYTLTVAATEEVAAYLRSCGYEVAAYSGKTDQAERLAAEEALLQNKVKALVATSALGMGYDKPDLGFVVHLGAPSSPIAYYQQVGRAGRAVDNADVLLLPGPEDEAIWRYFASVSFPAADQVNVVLAALGDSGTPLSTQALEAKTDLRRTRLELLLKVLDVDGAVRRVKGGWVATGQPWEYDAERYGRVAAARETEQQAMRDYAALTSCRMEFLRHQLDDPDAVPCGRCDGCTGSWYPVEISPAARAQAATFLGKPGVELEPRKLWPGGPAKGKIAEQAESGRAVGRLSDLGWGPRLRELLQADAEIPDDVFAAAVGVLKGWGWAERPVGVISIPSRTRPRLVSSLARRLATVGRLADLGELRRIGGGPPGAYADANSAHRLGAVYGAFEAPPIEIAGPVLLIDDYLDSGWTMTVAARELRLAGAPAVLPLVLGLVG